MSPPALPTTLLPDASFPALKDIIISRTGHFYYHDKDDVLWERVSRRMRAGDMVSCAEYLRRLRDPVLGVKEWAALESEITIGETYFFRYADQFDALRQTILPEILTRNAESRSIRIWSAGCSTGAEPYSIAIILRDLLGERIADWRISIIGTDIDEAALDTARQGIFGRWALRSTPDDLIARYFTPQAGNRSFQLRSEYRAMARFERHNLLSLLDGTSPLQFSDFDLVLCRNVLIYFHYETGERILRGLRDTMVDGGWLLVGNAEPNPALASVFETRAFPGATAYRRVEALAQPAAPAAEASIAPPPAPAAVRYRPRPEPTAPARRRPETASLPPRETAVAGPDSLAALAALIEAGETAEALGQCEILLAQEPENKLLHFRRGLCLHALRRETDAEQAFRRAIFLDRTFIAAHYHLGLLLAGRRQPRDARRALTNALRLAAAQPSGTVVPEGDGLTAGELSGGIALQLDIMGLRTPIASAFSDVA
ncbi:CheR family methyltransferase [Iodidimonas sp. SYSU 1G8]|uniref:CheR family methyltransferase n=1 Tax=Iodidimonas sp. SYSU 1G8 TaxID=3133967 RepID=UPI0031FE5BD9